MIHLTVRRLKPERRGAVEAWLSELNGPRRSEAIETLRAEGVSHESALIIDTSDGPVIVYAMETDDIEHARAVGRESQLPMTNATVKSCERLMPARYLIGSFSI